MIASNNSSFARVGDGILDIGSVVKWHEVTFCSEPNNKYDSKAVGVYEGKEKVGYLYKGVLQDIMNGWLKRGDPVWGTMSSVDLEDNSMKIDMAFYWDMKKILNSDDCIKAKLGRD